MNPFSKEAAARTILPLRAAVYHAVHDQRGGVGAVAGALGFNPNTLQHKINPNSDRHNLSLADFEAILSFTRDGRLMDSLCGAFGDAAWLDLRTGAISDTQLITGAAELFERVGRMGRDIALAMQDGRITRDELSTLEKDAALLHQTVQAIIARATAMLEA